jgi:hypothetical protein
MNFLLRSLMYAAIALTVCPHGALSQAGASRFDGSWTVRQSSNSHCQKSTPSWRLQVKGSAISARMDGVMRYATVDSSGAFQLESMAGDGRSLKLSGTMRGQSGSGNYRVDGTRCAGTFTMSRN